MKDLEGDAFGLIYEYFFAKFALAEGSGRGRVLHADVDREADRRDHRAVSRSDSRSGLRLGGACSCTRPTSSNAIAARPVRSFPCSGRRRRGEEPELASGKSPLFSERFPDGVYADVTGLCKVATIEEIEAQGWSLNPGRYVGIEVEELDDEVFDGVLGQLLSEST